VFTKRKIKLEPWLLLLFEQWEGSRRALIVALIDPSPLHWKQDSIAGHLDSTGNEPLGGEKGEWRKQESLEGIPFRRREVENEMSHLVLRSTAALIEDGFPRSATTTAPQAWRLDWELHRRLIGAAQKHLNAHPPWQHANIHIGNTGTSPYPRPRPRPRPNVATSVEGRDPHLLFHSVRWLPLERRRAGGPRSEEG
jgi:hypothetical protein